MKKIKLTRGFTALVSNKDYKRVSQFKWRAMVHPRTVYAVRSLLAPDRGKSEYLHVFIMGTRGIDHRDHNGLNCQRRNLRRASQRLNIGRARKFKGTSKYKGVHRHSVNPVWVASISTHTACTYLGSFKTQRKAALAYDRAARKAYGKFALTNF